ncbi:hypothetical protein Y032_0184g982 [Ancylostoma ceylanicum]|uniref:Uncharacterized protein n=1 Tax=Ancylostoma ceylanicum TaxID=53326 RepID=A0A016SSB3_9BILA|nr:hypothetical protein Y032_0184g982 [Ancylostoma ceylanicum]
MLVALYCALALLSVTYVVMTCFNFRKKKNGSPYSPSRTKTPQAAGKSGSDVHASTSKIKTPGTRRSKWSRTKLPVVHAQRASTTVSSTVQSAAGTATPQSAEQGYFQLSILVFRTPSQSRDRLRQLKMNPNEPAI